MTDTIKVFHKGLNAEERLIELGKWQKHRAWNEYVDYHRHHHNNKHPMDAAVADIAWLAKNNDWDELGGRDHSAEFIHPRYGKVMEQRTFYPFPDWLHHNEYDLKNQGIQVILEYPTGWVLDNMAEHETRAPVPRPM